MNHLTLRHWYFRNRFWYYSQISDNDRQMFGTQLMYFFLPLSISKRFYINFIYFVSNFKDSIPRISFQHDPMFWLIWSQFPYQSFNLWQCVVRYGNKHTHIKNTHTHSLNKISNFIDIYDVKHHKHFLPQPKQISRQPPFPLTILHYKITHIWKI